MGVIIIHYTGLAAWLELWRGTFTCVEWQVTPCDPIWQVMLSSYETVFPGP